MRDRPTYAALIDGIIAFYDIRDANEVVFWSDNYDGRAWHAFPTFWETLSSRAPSADIEDVLSAWSIQELHDLWTDLLWDRRTTRDIQRR